MYGRSTNWFDTGLEAFHEKDHAPAVSCFEKYLKNDPDQSHASDAHTYLALSRMALAPPRTRDAEQIRDIVLDLARAGSRPLIGTLAQVIMEDWGHRAGDDRQPWSDDLAGLAGLMLIEALTADELRLIRPHLAAHRGETWSRLCQHARRHRLAFSDEENHAPDPRRRGLVARYCAARPARPAAAGTSGASVGSFAAVGAGALVAAWLGDVLVRPWTSGFVLFLALLVLGAILLGTAVVRWRRWRADRRLARQYDRDVATANPSATDAQMDAWLTRDVDKIISYGRQRRLLNRDGSRIQQELSGEPQVLVGLSGLGRIHRHYRDAPEIEPHSLLEFQFAETENPLAMTACRRSDHDGALRANRYDVMVLFPEKDGFFVFRTDLDLATGRLLTASTQTLRYDTGITVYARDMPTRGLPENPVTAWYDDGAASRRQVFVDRCFAITMPGQRVEIATGISRHRAGRLGPVTVAWPNQATQCVIEHLLWSRPDEPGGAGAEPAG